MPSFQECTHCRTRELCRMGKKIISCLGKQGNQVYLNSFFPKHSCCEFKWG